MKRHLKDYRLNSIHIVPFQGHDNDKALMTMTQYLIKLTEFEDIRPVVSEWMDIVQKSNQKTTKLELNNDSKCEEENHASLKFPAEKLKNTMNGVHRRHLSLTIPRKEREETRLFKRWSAELIQEKQEQVTTGVSATDSEDALFHLNEDLDEQIIRPFRLHILQPKLKAQVDLKLYN